MTNKELATLYRETALAYAVAHDGTGNQLVRASATWHVDNAREAIAVACDPAGLFDRGACLAGIAQVGKLLIEMETIHA